MNSWLWNPPTRSEWPRLLLECVVIVALGIIVGLSVNVELLRQVWSGEQVSTASQQTSLLPEPVALEEVLELLADGALAVDARLPEQFAQGRLPKAYNLPLVDYVQEIARFVAQIPVGRTLVVYCNGYGCPDSFDLGQLLLQRGYKDVRIFEGGFPEWRDSGLTVEGGPQ